MANEEINVLKRELTAAAAANDGVRVDVVAPLKAQLAEAEEQRVEAEEQRAEAEAKGEGDTKQISLLQSRLKSQQSQLSEAAGRAEQSEGGWQLKLQEAESRAYEAIDMCDEADKMVAGKNKMVEAKDEEIWNLKEATAAKGKEVAALVMHVELLDKKVGDLKDRATRHQEDLNLAAGESGGLKEKLGVMERRAEAAESRNRTDAANAANAAKAKVEREKKEREREKEKKEEEEEMRTKATKKKKEEEREKRVRETAVERGKVRGRSGSTERMMKGMQARNRVLEKEIEELRRQQLDSSTASSTASSDGSSDASAPSPPPHSSSSSSSKSLGAGPLRPPAPFARGDGGLTKTHEDCLRALTAMKKNLSEELAPGKRRKQAPSPAAEAKRKETLLKRMDAQVDTLLAELSAIKGTLEERDETLTRMGSAVQALQDDRTESRTELEAQDKFVRRANEMLERETAWRKQAEEQFGTVQAEIDKLEAQNGKLREGAEMIDADWKQKVASMRFVCKSLGIFLGGGVKNRERRVMELSRGFFVWKKVAAQRGGGGGGGGGGEGDASSSDASSSPLLAQQLDDERKLNTDLMTLSTTNATNSSQRITWLEEENGQLKGELEAVGENSRMLLDAGREMREEVEVRMNVAEGLGVLSGVLQRARTVRAAKFFRRWANRAAYELGLKRGKGNSEATARDMEAQLESTKVKLQRLKGALRDGGFIAKTPVKGSKGSGGEGGGEGGSDDDGFFWELSSDEESTKA